MTPRAKKSPSADDMAPVPAPFETADLWGHDDAQATFIDSLASGRFAHAWLISGPRGIGKATLAFRFARALLAHGQGARSLDMSPSDPVFLRIKAGTHGNLKVLERGFQKSNPTKRAEIIDVAEVRAVGDFLSMSSAEGGWRVVLVDEAETMNASSANALLKVLEEPPPKSALFLVSHNAGRLLETIRSRCRKLPLRPLDQAVLDPLMSRHLPNVGGDQKRLLMTLSEGSIGRAISLSRHLALWNDVTDLLGSLPRMETTRLHALGDLADRDADTFDALAELLPWWLSRLIRHGATGGDAPFVGGGNTALEQRFLRAAPLDRWVEVWENVHTLFRRTRGLYLDRKQTVLSSFHLIGRTVGPS